MLRSRVIPCLLIHNKGLVKTVKFKDPKYVGDPINAVKIFNEKEVDELMVLDIDATVNGAEPDYKAIAHMAAECRMPLCYGGGIKTVAQAQKIIKLGVEKVALSSSVVESPGLVREIAEIIGCQSVVVVLDIKKSMLGSYEIHTHNAKQKIRKDLISFVKEIEEQGSGELVINSINNDGVMKGYDLKLADKIRQAVSLPVTFLGGAGAVDDIYDLINRYQIIGAAAGSLFVFKGVYKAVLISYLPR
jgi:cyclase